jgi:predicted nicotinamide N-methyase
VPHAAEIRLHVADEATALWQKTEEELGAMGLPPPFWAFAWAGGQGLARFVLDHPEHVRGHDVLDFASGSGLVAIAAALAGATTVEAADIDPFAVAAIGVNAALNGVADRINATGDDLIDRDHGWDTVLVADICYQRDIALRVMPWLRRLQARGAAVLIGDPGRSYLPRQDLVPIAAYEVPTTRALEDSAVKRTQVWRLAAP